MLEFASSDVDGLMNEAMEKIRGQIRTADRVVFLLQEGHQLSIKAAHGGRPGREMPAERVSRAILRRVRRTGRTLFLSDALADNGLAPRQSIQEIGQRSVICAPLKTNGKVVGLVYADTVSMIAAFTPAHLDWVNELTESLNSQLQPLIPERVETVVNDDFLVPKTEAPDPYELPTSVPEPPPIKMANFRPERVENVYGVDRKEAVAAARKADSEMSLGGQDLASFYRGIASMLSSGITVHRALDVLSEQSPAIAPVARQLYESVIAGNRLSVSMARFPKIFGLVHRSLVRVGEETGSLDTLMTSLAQDVEGSLALRGKIISALTYPVMVTICCVLGCLIAPPMFLNDFFLTLSSSGVQLPLVTRAVMAISNAAWSPFTWVTLAALVWATRFALARARQNPELVKNAEQRFLELPVIGPLRQAFYLLDFMQTLALQLEAGLRLDKSLMLSAAVSGNTYLQEQTAKVVESVKEGASLSWSLQRTKVFPRTVVEFIALGEETGKMSESCRFAEALLRERAESALETAESLMEPLAISLVGTMVGVVALACMLPLVRMFEAFV